MIMISVRDFYESLISLNGVNSIKEIEDIVNDRNKNIKVNITKISLEKCNGWVLDDSGVIHNESNSFFQIKGIEYSLNNKPIVKQPIIIQNEIGYLGIIVKKINGILHFLMQAKIEPGNINKVQISPTIQATKSNFEQKHGGKKPAYLEYFLNSNKYNIVVDQIQSEQSSRFLGKRNRNIIIDIGDEDIEVLSSHFWLTLGQIKKIMEVDNLVNMDTRTVLSCIPFWKFDSTMLNKENININKYFYNSIFNEDEITYVEVFKKINDFKMFNDVQRNLISLNKLDNWRYQNNEFVCKNPYNFKVIFCDLNIEGREVKQRCQPLFEATGKALFVLLCSKFGSKYKYLVKLTSEIGTFDTVELGPSIQCEGSEINTFLSSRLGKFYLDNIKAKEKIKNDVILSEEGGRFYHEENRNVIIEVNHKELEFLDEHEYMWLDFKTLNFLVQFNNVLNIQLRNLLSIIGR